MGAEKIPDFITALQQPSCYDHPVDKVSLIQTHISLVLLAGEYVYKFKKPVDFGFLDFTTLEKRAHFCEQELVLNRRLCPDIYLERVAVTLDESGYRLNGPGTAVEYGVKMVRLPEERMMGRLIAASALTKAHIDAIIATLVPFYQKAAGGEALRSYGTAESVGVNVLENFDQTASFVGGPALSRDQFERISSYARQTLADADRFHRRLEAGKIRECHGDLYSANICLDRQVHIFDCIEFNERFRYSDVAADVAFLAMDLDYHHCDDLADYFLQRFVLASLDPDLNDVVGFYKCYRAYVRGKIGLFTAADPAVDPAASAVCTDQARRYFELADRYARQ